MISNRFLNTIKVMRLEIGEEDLPKLLRIIFSTEAATKIFYALLDNPELDALEIMKITGIPESTIYRILKTFQKEKIIELSRRYRETDLIRKNKRDPDRVARSLRGGRCVSSWRLKIDA